MNNIDGDWFKDGRPNKNDDLLKEHDSIQHEQMKCEK